MLTSLDKGLGKEEFLLVQVETSNLVSKMLHRIYSRFLMLLLLKCNIFKRLLNIKSTPEVLPGHYQKCQVVLDHRMEEEGVSIPIQHKQVIHIFPRVPILVTVSLAVMMSASTRKVGEKMVVVLAEERREAF